MGSGGKTGIVVPEHAIDELAAGKRPPVLASCAGAMSSEVTSHHVQIFLIVDLTESP